MMRRALYAILMIVISLVGSSANAASGLTVADLGGLFRLLGKQPHNNNQNEQKPRRLRELRLKEAVRRGDLSPDEAKVWNRNKQRLREGNSQQEDMRLPPNQPGRSHWRDTQRRQWQGDQ
jgi:hypothetical protein